MRRILSSARPLTVTMMPTTGIAQMFNASDENATMSYQSSEGCLQR